MKKRRQNIHQHEDGMNKILVIIYFEFCRQTSTIVLELNRNMEKMLSMSSENFQNVD